MATKSSLAEQISRWEVMLAGINEDPTVITNNGGTVEEISQLAGFRTKTIDANNRQEALKAEQKESTAEVNTNLDGGNTIYRRFRKIIKLAVPQELWLKFGIEAKR